MGYVTKTLEIQIVYGRDPTAWTIDKIIMPDDENTVRFKPLLVTRTNGIHICGLRCGFLYVRGPSEPQYVDGNLTVCGYVLDGGIRCGQFALCRAMTMDTVRYTVDSVRTKTGHLIANAKWQNPLLDARLANVAATMPRIDYVEYLDAILALTTVDPTDPYETRRCTVEIWPHGRGRRVDIVGAGHKITVLCEALQEHVGQRLDVLWQKDDPVSTGALVFADGTRVPCDFPGQVIHRGRAQLAETDTSVHRFLAEVGTTFTRLHEARILATNGVRKSDFEILYPN